MPTFEFWRNWTVFGAILSAIVVYYARTGPKRRGRAGAPVVTNTAKRRTSPRRSSAQSGSHSGNVRSKSHTIQADEPETSSPAVAKPDKAKKRKGGNGKSSQLAQSSATDPNTSQGARDGHQEAEEASIDNREFAKQMAGLKTGSSIAKPEGPKNKSKKQGKQAEMPLSSYNPLVSEVNGKSGLKDLSSPSSTAGVDADDDLSPNMSPRLNGRHAATSGDVSDMLEAPTKGPSVLRLTGVEEPKRQSKPPKAVQEVESKKQRQNRRKKEEQRAAREEDERERRILLEKQLRSAREAEGRPAKNGLGSAPATSAWSKPSTNNVVSSSSTVPPASHGSLLDTFDDGHKPTVNGHHHQGQATAAADKKSLHTDVPSEEEQLRILSEMEGNGGWNTVTTGKKRRPAASNDKENQRKTSSASMSGSASNSGDSINQATPSQSQTDDESIRVPGNKVDVDRNIWNFDNIKDHPEYDADYPHALLGHPGDSDWAVV
ncbi:MAG: hypothetical protein Q9168_004853 [Polycauliona sp. 1 TL-2023]